MIINFLREVGISLVALFSISLPSAVLLSLIYDDIELDSMKNLDPILLPFWIMMEEGLMRVAPFSLHWIGILPLPFTIILSATIDSALHSPNVPSRLKGLKIGYSIQHFFIGIVFAYLFSLFGFFVIWTSHLILDYAVLLFMKLKNE